MNVLTNTIGESSPVPMKVLNVLLPAISFLLTAAGLDIDWQYIALAAGSSIAGSLLLGYFRPEKTFGSQVNKMSMATIGGIIVGSAVVQYRDLTSAAYVSLAYFGCSIVVLIFVRTFVGLFEANAGSLTTTLIQRVFNVKLDGGGEPTYTAKGGTRKRRNDIHISQSPNSPPTVMIGDSAKPDEIKIIEQTVVDTKTKEGI